MKSKIVMSVMAVMLCAAFAFAQDPKTDGAKGDCPKTCCVDGCKKEDCGKCKDGKACCDKCKTDSKCCKKEACDDGAKKCTAPSKDKEKK